MKKVIINGIEYISKEIETWIDPETGLIWEKQGLDQTMTWKEAIEYAKTLGNGWRLPTIQELFSLVDFSRGNLACKNINTYLLYYWTNDMYYTWHVCFNNGNVYYDDKSSNYYVRCVKREEK
ncbi:MAG: Lcl C-terminal domain-containing protein [Candidatus Ranarchaeia archaeon]